MYIYNLNPIGFDFVPWDFICAIHGFLFDEYNFIYPMRFFFIPWDKLNPMELQISHSHDILWDDVKSNGIMQHPMILRQIPYQLLSLKI